jgi:hypothetical protein
MALRNRRGGKHAVKDEDLTHTKYDDYSRQQLFVATKEAGLYVKDDKKSVMARKLADRDQILQLAERRAAQKRNEMDGRRLQEEKNEEMAKKARRRARAERNNDREQKCEVREDVRSDSEDSIDTDEEDKHDAHKCTVTDGDVLSDVSFEDDESDSSVLGLEGSPVEQDCKLSLFEWPYTTMPLPYPPTTPRAEQHPTALTFAPMKLITTQTREKVTLPGLKYPAGIDPDVAPILDPLTRNAVRHGHLVGLLAHAVVEPATIWASRTIVQGWNGRIYFALPPPNSTRDDDLQRMYQEWDIEHRKLLQPTPGMRNLEAAKADRKRRSAQRRVIKRRQTVELYKACKWRPQAIGYAPAYLDWQKGSACNTRHQEGTLVNLFYIRFQGCDVPHYYFWAGEGERSDPTNPDPEWSPEVFEQQNAAQTAVGYSSSLAPTKIRVRRLTAPPTARHDCLVASSFEPTLVAIESDLCTYGLLATLCKSKACASCAGKEQAWNIFTRNLPALYPSGGFPTAPLVAPVSGMCVAEKLAALLSGRGVICLSGEESWTRNDDAVWDIFSCVEDEDVPMSEDAAMEGVGTLQRSCLNSNNEAQNESSMQALCRCDSTDACMQPKERRVWAWLENISSRYSPRVLPLLSSSTPAELEPQPEPISPLDLNDTIAQLNLNHTSTVPACSFCNLSWAAMKNRKKAAHMLSHFSILHPALSTQRISQTHAVGTGVKRRHSYLHTRTLTRYSSLCDKERNGKCKDAED